MYCTSLKNLYICCIYCYELYATISWYMFAEFAIVTISGTGGEVVAIA